MERNYQNEVADDLSVQSQTNLKLSMITGEDKLNRRQAKRISKRNNKKPSPQNFDPEATTHFTTPLNTVGRPVSLVPSPIPQSNIALNGSRIEQNHNQFSF